MAKLLHTSVEEVKDAKDHLLTFNPKPGNGDSRAEGVPYILPDLFVETSGSGFAIFANDNTLPRAEINEYYSRLAAQPGDRELRVYLRHNLSRAQWVISGIEQRRTTLLRCTEAIVRRQAAFFRAGPGHLLPPTLADVATELEVHPSTASRAVHEKHLQCQWGIFALSHFSPARSVKAPMPPHKTVRGMLFAALLRARTVRSPCRTSNSPCYCNGRALPFPGTLWQNTAKP